MIDIRFSTDIDNIAYTVLIESTEQLLLNYNKPVYIKLANILKQKSMQIYFKKS